ncbi:MAG: hypothetical protein B6D37_13640 [Sphingobacteriales bacterium UTBCD1]|jgi:hypothetical protein|nr:MAG: hypothetical protein B6D37_13640 [Sphingobacteriales bacterium UTBCD1]
MNRRKFFQKTGALSVALAGLPLAKRAKNADAARDKYMTELDRSKSDQIGCTLYMYHKAVIDLSKATDTEKELDIVVSYYKDPKDILNAKSCTYTFKITGVEAFKADNDYKIIKTTGRRMRKDEYPWPKELPLNPQIRIKMFTTAALLDSNGKVFSVMAYSDPSDNDMDDIDCFITTACVTERGLADDCDELTTLRRFRENYMRNTVQGRKLLNEYGTLGPDVVSAISKCANRSEIYDYLYRYMIVPAVAMIKGGEYQQAADWYEGFSLQLKRNYC